MPYADPDKQREAKRRYEQEKRKQRRTNWMLVFYEDQCPEWRDELDEVRGDFQYPTHGTS